MTVLRRMSPGIAPVVTREGDVERVPLRPVRKRFVVPRDADAYVTRTGPNQLVVPSRLTVLIR